jgi:hypothetical protein
MVSGVMTDSTIVSEVRQDVHENSGSEHVVHVENEGTVGRMTGRCMKFKYFGL